MTDPTSTDAPSWLQDIETTKQLLSNPSLANNRLASRCLEVIHRLCSPVAYYYPIAPTGTTSASSASAATTTAGAGGGVPTVATGKTDGVGMVPGTGTAPAHQQQQQHQPPQHPHPPNHPQTQPHQHQHQNRHPQNQQQPLLMHFPDQLFNDPTFGGIFPDVDQELNLNLNPGGMDFSEWLNFTP